MINLHATPCNEGGYYFYAALVPKITSDDTPIEIVKKILLNYDVSHGWQEFLLNNLVDAKLTTSESGNHTICYVVLDDTKSIEYKLKYLS